MTRTGPPPAITLPLGPLLAAARRGRPLHTGPGCPCSVAAHLGRTPGYCYTVADLAEDLRIKRTTVNGWHRRGGLPIDRGDEVACAVGLHPALIWPDEWPAWAGWAAVA